MVDDDKRVLNILAEAVKRSDPAAREAYLDEACGQDQALRDQVESQGAKLDCIGFGATGYAADVLEEVALADVNIVETVAHMMSAVHFFGDVDVICDIGGQDIKVLFMKHGEIANFKLSNSCSAGNGMLLQAMADHFGLPVTKYAETATAM